MRLETYIELDTIKECRQKRITLVKSEIDHLYYIKKELLNPNLAVIEQLSKVYISHIPNILYYEALQDKVTIIEEYIPYPTLDVYLQEHEILEEEAKQIILQLCAILKELHHLSPPLIHKDIKPENIFYNGSDLYLFDFDIARNVGEKNRDTRIMGSENYASPEHFGFKQSDARSDIYSLGILFNVLLTGCFPYEKKAKGKYQMIIEKMTAIDPDNRYLTIEKVEDALKDHKDFTLPGFRSGKLTNKLIAVIGYISILLLALWFLLTDVNTKQLNIAIAIMILIFGATTITFTCNYMQIYDHCLFSKSKNIYIRIAGILLTAFIIYFIAFWVCAIMGSL